MNPKQIPFFILVILFCASLLGCKVQGAEVQGDPFDLAPDQNVIENAIFEIGSIDPTVDQQLQILLGEGGLPSFTVGIVVEDELVWAKSYNGVAGIDTVYIIGSVSKPFIATAILQLYERGLIDLDADINEYLPFAVRHPKFPDELISVRTLLTNRSGLAMDAEDYIRFQNPDEVISEYVSYVFGIDLPELNLETHPSRAEFFKAFLTPGGEYYSKEVWSETPGTYQYSNIGYGLLAYIIECVTGVSVEEYLQTSIFDHLEMAHSGAELAGLEAYHAYPYQRVQGGYIRIPFRGIPFHRFCEILDLGCVGKNLFSPGGYFPVPDDINQHLKNGYLRFPLYENLVGNGGARTSVPDLSKFMLAHMNAGRAPNGYQLLQPETVKMMHEIAVPTEGSINLIPTKGYGMGWTIAQGGIQGHIGGASGYEAEMLYKETPQGKFGIIFLRNWDWELADDYENGFEYWKKYHVGVREILMEEAERMLQ
ncbi:MAG: serine hydrolase [Anaerolineales bacterium]|jgi:CubicO group peptidase (beta-lactamase class C family)